MTLLFFFFPVVIAVVLSFAFGRRAGPLVAGAIALWFALSFALSQLGVFAQFEALPPRLPMAVLGAIALGVLLSRVRAVRERLDEMPAWWPVAFQGFRFPLELMLFALFTRGLMPRQMTFEGSNFDVLVGVTAPVMAWLIAKGRASRGVQMAWQLGAIGLLLNVVRVAVTSAPGPLHLEWPGEPLTVVASWPFALVPTFLVPMAALGHVAAVRRLLREDAGQRGRNSQCHGSRFTVS